ncbi:MAG: cytochrome b [Flavobacteriaceae bacterium]
MTERYSRPMLGLHWLIVVLLVVQYFSSDGASHVHRATARGTQAEAFDVTLSNIHIWTGIAVLVLTALRFAVRLFGGVPAPTPGLSVWEERGARIGHIALYALLVIVPASGAASVWINPEAGDVHELLTNLLWAVTGVHVAGALWHYVVKRDGVMSRMAPWLKPLRN